jgi:3-methylcrotonyl-CoA carboxylase alpha subunit
MFRVLLVANRGEIACRIIRTARAMGLRVIAVHSEADADALHVHLADESHLLGPAPASESYLRVDAVLAAARASGADAIHPGYGFLAERADFAEACAAAGVRFVGPPPAALRALGDKREARALMRRAGVPVLPGDDGVDGDLAAAAAAIGFPVLVKAAAGGGGRGMRVVADPGDLPAALESCEREAAAAFGDGRLLVERFVERARHVEVQVVADAHGGAVHLFERDCSVQRRLQKVIEEAPAPAVDDDMSRAMTDVALVAARAAGYVGAGTVEMLLEPDGAFWFMEMNARLQVEHPVTEAITGLDLVEWQLRVAAGEPLPRRQEDIRRSGHAVEARLYAEDPARDLLPAAGRLRALRLPAGFPGVRVDTGIRAGDEVTLHYDPLLAKVIAHGADRAEAVRRLAAALSACELAGVATNLPLLRAVLARPEVARGPVDTGFLARHAAELLPPAGPAPERAVALAALALLLAAEPEAAGRPGGWRDPRSPWASRLGWRLGGGGEQPVRLRDGPRELELRVRYPAGGLEILLPSGPVRASGRLDGERLEADLDGVRLRTTVSVDRDEVLVVLDGRAHRLTLVDPAAGELEGAAAGGLSAPMPGQVRDVRVAPGDRVRRGAPLVILEAMKMELTVAAPVDGRVTEVRCRPGERVDEGAELLALEPEGKE